MQKKTPEREVKRPNPGKSMSATTYVCWEWQRDDGGFCPYIPEVSHGIESAYKSGQSSFIVSPYTIDFTTLTQQRYGGRTRQVRRMTVDLGTGPDLTGYWMWSMCPKEFVCYQVEASVDIERAYSKGAAIVNLSKCSSQLPYTINLKQMTQTRHHYNTKREIKRVPLSPGHTLQGLLRVGGSPSGLSGASSSGGGGSGSGGSGYGTAPGAVGLSYPSASVPPYSVSHPILSSSGHALPMSTTHSSSFGGLAPSHFNHAPSFGSPSPLYPGHATGLPPHHHTHHGHTHHGHTHHGHGMTLPPSTAALASAPLTTFSFYTTPVSSSHHTSTAAHHTSHTSTAARTALSSTTSLSKSSSGSVTRSKSKSAGPKVLKSGSSSAAPTTSSAAIPPAPRTAAASKKSVSVPAAKKSGTAGIGRSRARRGGRTAVAPGAVGVVTSPDDALSTYARKVNKLRPKHDEPCPICMNKLSEESGFEDDDNTLSIDITSPHCVYRLRKCGHKLHRSCLAMYIKNSSKGGFQCPTCKKPYGARTGDMPNGSMTVQTYGHPLPGHPGVGTIQITYSFHPGTHNGRRYRANGFPRVCYLPNSEKGQKVLRLLRVAWDRKLTFTIGTSVTTGTTDTVVWNEIHHKTESHSNSSGHGYPDPTYLDRVLLELAAQGVEDGGEEEEDGEVESSESSSDEEPAQPVAESKVPPVITLCDSDDSDL